MTRPPPFGRSLLQIIEDGFAIRQRAADIAEPSGSAARGSKLGVGGKLPGIGLSECFADGVPLRDPVDTGAAGFDDAGVGGELLLVFGRPACRLLDQGFQIGRAQAASISCRRPSHQRLGRHA